MSALLTDAFRAFSARLGRDPLQVQGPGGNTSIKADGRMWVKASGTQLADAESEPIFVEVDHAAALAEAGGAGDGTCKAAVIDPANTLRPSIETTFHAALPWAVVAHTHSVATLVHAISPQGRRAAAEKLAGLAHVFVPYCKPGVPLTQEITRRLQPETKVIVLENHGLICCGDSVEEAAEIMEDVEGRLQMPARDMSGAAPSGPAPEGFAWEPAVAALASEPRAFRLASSGSYYPDHVVFLGPALPTSGTDAARPAWLVEGEGVVIKTDATASQRAMLQCQADVLGRLPEEWSAEPIGVAAEAQLLDWDAEKYRQALAQRAQ